MCRVHNGLTKERTRIARRSATDLYEIPITLQATSSRKNMRQVAPHRGNTGTDDGAAIDLKRREKPFAYLIHIKALPRREGT
jgi:hypothetical protein